MPAALYKLHGTDSGEVIILKAKNYAIKQFDVFVRSSRLLYCREVRGRVIKSVKKSFLKTFLHKVSMEIYIG